MKISIVTHNFPHPKFPQSGAFVNKLAHGLNEAGGCITVYSLVSKTHLLIRRASQEVSININEDIIVRYVNYVSFSNKRILGFSSAEIGLKIAFHRLNKCFNQDINTDSIPDVLYGKFLFAGGRHVALLSQRYGIPAVADLGESTLLERLNSRELNKARDIIRHLCGVVCVSPRLASEAIQLGMKPERILVAPNGIDMDKFFPISKGEAREVLGLPKDKKIILFVGHFIDRKGPDRVLDAIELLTKDYCGVFLGEGKIELSSTRVLFKGRVPNEQLNLWLNAADVFCLPTLAEGSCNAIEEARAVGLPIVTSNIPDITDFESSKEYILVNPLDIKEISSAIHKAANMGPINYKNLPLCNKVRSAIIMDWLKKLKK